MRSTEERKRAKEAARKLRDKDLNMASGQIERLGLQIEKTKEGSPEEKDLMKRRNRFIKFYERRREQ